MVACNLLLNDAICDNIVLYVLHVTHEIHMKYRNI